MTFTSICFSASLLACMRERERRERERERKKERKTERVGESVGVGLDCSAKAASFCFSSPTFLSFYLWPFCPSPFHPLLLFCYDFNFVVVVIVDNNTVDNSVRAVLSFLLVSFLKESKAEADLFGIVPHVYPTTQSVKGLNWTEGRSKQKPTGTQSQIKLVQRLCILQRCQGALNDEWADRRVWWFRCYVCVEWIPVTLMKKTTFWWWDL